ncbi:MAG: hypothetical protein E7376_03255 [Clostridiales bacterium]|nr:hypothetical protein [Clostridiales bacterium]
MDLKCRKTTCKYNNYFTCDAKNIAITTNLECDSFCRDPERQVRDTSRCLFEEPPKYAPHREKKSMRVVCAAKCLFNCQGTCVANGLTINDINECPYCITFIKP